MKRKLIMISTTTVLLSGCSFNAGVGLDVDPPEEQKTSYTEKS